MVNIESHPDSLLRDDDPSRCLRKMNSSTHLHDYLTKNISVDMLAQDEDDDDDDFLMPTSPIAMTSSDSGDSAIVSDDVDDVDVVQDKHVKSRNSWPKAMERSKLTASTTFTSLSQSFSILNQLEQPTIYHKSPNRDHEKYKHPLPWQSYATSARRRRPSPPPPPAPPVEVASNKVSFFVREKQYSRVRPELINI